MKTGDGDALGEHTKLQLYAQSPKKQKVGLVYLIRHVPIPLLNNAQVFRVARTAPAHPPGKLL